MAIDGLKILESDLAWDIYEEFMESYDSNYEIHKIREKIEQWENECVNDLEKEIYLTTYGLALWEIGELDDNLYKIIEDFIYSEKGLIYWAEDAQHYKTRKKILHTFLKKIGKVNKNPRARKRYKKVKRTYFDAGDCVYLRVNNEYYSIAVVVEVYHSKGDCTYFFGSLDYYSKEIPSEYYLTNSRFYGHRTPNYCVPEKYSIGFETISVSHKYFSWNDEFKKFFSIKLKPSPFLIAGGRGATSLKQYEQALNFMRDDFEGKIEYSKGLESTIELIDLGIMLS